jgi:1-acyl-sn-glycerol-3-phosphate acyltransferase
MPTAGIHITPLGDRVPRWGGGLTRAFGNAVVRLFGWRVEGEVPNREKFVVLVAPHTTGWDFPICLMTLIGMGIRASWLGVDWMFRYPLMHKLGGIPVDRGARLGVVPQSIERFKSGRQHILGISPEGSRKKVVPWKTGFYHIAVGAEVPILMVTVDQRAKRIAIGPTFTPSGDYQADMAEHIRPVYARFADKYPDRFGI